jgi:hypothetical protein
MRRLSLLILMFVISLILCLPAFGEGNHAVHVGTLTGRVVFKSPGPVKNGTVFFYNVESGPPPSATKYWRVPTEAFRLDAEGRFNASLKEGVYYMGAIMRLSTEPLGPPHEGDYFLISQDKKGVPLKYTVRKDTSFDAGSITGSRPFRQSSMVRAGLTSIEGTIMDAKGAPLEGMIVFAFSTSTLAGKPLFVTERSGKDGKYRLRLAEGGTYYLKARTTYEGGPPSAAEVMGTYKDGRPVVVKTGGKAKEINIEVRKVGVPEQ